MKTILDAVKKAKSSYVKFNPTKIDEKGNLYEPSTGVNTTALDNTSRMGYSDEDRGQFLADFIKDHGEALENSDDVFVYFTIRLITNQPFAYLVKKYDTPEEFIELHKSNYSQRFQEQ